MQDRPNLIVYHQSHCSKNGPSRMMLWSIYLVHPMQQEFLNSRRKQNKKKTQALSLLSHVYFLDRIHVHGHMFDLQVLVTDLL